MRCRTHIITTNVFLINYCMLNYMRWTRLTRLYVRTWVFVCYFLPGCVITYLQRATNSFRFPTIPFARKACMPPAIIYTNVSYVSFAEPTPGFPHPSSANSRTSCSRVGLVYFTRVYIGFPSASHQDVGLRANLRR